MEETIVTAEPAERAPNLPEALTELELPFRATLQLSYRRGMSDSAIADVAGLDEAEVARQRQRAVEWLARRTSDGEAHRLEEVEEGLRELSAEGWAGRSEEEDAAEATADEVAAGPSNEPPPDAVADVADVADVEEGEEDEEPGPEPHPFPTQASGDEADGATVADHGRRRWLPVAATLLGLALLAGVALVAAGGSSDPADPITTSAAAPQAPAQPTGQGSGATGEEGSGSEGGSNAKGDKGAGKPAGSGSSPGQDEAAGEATGDPPAVEMIPMDGAVSPGDVMAAVAPGEAGGSPTLTVALDGLPNPKGEYRAWLYASVIDSLPLAATKRGDGTIRASLPEDWERFPFVDVSIQQAGERAHSGRSVARIATQDLASP